MGRLERERDGGTKGAVDKMGREGRGTDGGRERKRRERGRERERQREIE